MEKFKNITPKKNLQKEFLNPMGIFYKTMPILAFIAVLIFSISCDKENDRPPVASIDKDKIITISDIYKLSQNNYNNDYIITGDSVLYATVTMDDNSGNINKEAYIQDSTGGINLYQLGVTGATQQGDYVRIKLKGTIIKNYEGKLELSFENIENFKKQIVVIKTNVSIVPEEVTIDDIFTNDYNCKLVKLKDIQFTDNTQNYGINSDSGYTNREVNDCDNKKITVRSSNLADFAQNKVAQGNGSMIGIITKYRNDWQFIIRSIDEVDMNDELCKKNI